MKCIKYAVILGMCGLVVGLTGLRAQDDLIRNGNFDLDHKFWEVGYPKEDTGIAIHELDDAPAGAGFVRLAPTNSAAPHHLVLQQKVMNTVSSGKYRLSGWMRISDDYAAKMPIVQIGWRLSDSANTWGSAVIQPDDSVSPGEWVRCENEVEIPSGVSSLYIFLFAYGSMGHVDFDGIQLEPIQ